MKQAKETEGTDLLRIVSMLLLSLGLAATVSAAERPADSTVSYYVKEALRNDARIDASKVAVTTTQGIVTLSGEVGTLAAQDYADREAKRIDGVLGVVNKITVKTVWRSDTDIAQEVRRRLLNSAVIESQGVTVTSQDGKVTLGGTITSYTETAEAKLLASEVRGVKEVVSEMTIQWPTQRDDQAIKNDAVAALERDVYLTGMPITVTVKDGVITLSGTVGNAFVKDRAADSVRWISHVTAVRNDLKVNWWENRGTRKKAPSPSDTELRKAVRAELDQDDRLDASQVSIEASCGQVTLNGSVPTHAQKDIAGREARDVVGVGWTTNNLFALTDKRPDWAVRDDIAFNLDTDSELADFGVSVVVQDGVATLSGDVHTWYQKSHAREVAAKVKGVKRVINQVSLVTDYAYERTHSGTMIAEQIRKRLKANAATKWAAAQITVTVKKGVAMLTGAVDDWAEREEAGKVAFHTEGVWKVDNRLTVEDYDYPYGNWYDEDGPYGPDYDEYLDCPEH